jgi:glutamate/tyrosine decarboxylase-like PLP-dependent enzyme
VPYDCGISIVARPAALYAAMGLHAHYLINADAGSDPMDNVPELSRRARGVPVWAALRSLGRNGVADLVDGLARHARAIAEGIGCIDEAEILNDVVFTQVSAAFGSDERTEEVTSRVLKDGTAWMSGSRWHDRSVLRVSVSNWSTDETDVRACVDAVRRAADGA